MQSFDERTDVIITIYYVSFINRNYLLLLQTFPHWKKLPQERLNLSRLQQVTSYLLLRNDDWNTYKYRVAIEITSFTILSLA